MFKERKIFCAFLLILFAHVPFVKSQSLYTQFDTNYFASPVDFPIYLSANFGELRSTHFHAGIDIKTGGVTGREVFAPAPGYVSRIKIQTGGYGKALYVNHPNGLVTVYAHLKDFNQEIDSFIKDYQYRNETHTLNLYPQAGQFTFSKGDLMAYAGNSGSSGGPHIHFEIRDARNQVPLNALKFYQHIRDDIPPRIKHLAIYALNDSSYIIPGGKKLILACKKVNNVYIPVTNTKIVAHGQIGIGVEAYDYMNGTYNRYAIYTIKCSMNDQLHYFHKTDQVSFGETKYLYSHIDYEEKVRSGKKIQKTFIDPNNRLNIYEYADNSGKINLNRDTIYEFKIDLNDVHNNSSVLQFEIEGNKEPNLLFVRKKEDFVKRFDYRFANRYESNDFYIDIPEGALFDHLDFTYSLLPPISEYGPHIKIHNQYTALFKRMEIAIKPNKNISGDLLDKLLIVSANDENDPSPLSSYYEQGYIKCKTRKFGKYTLSVDTVSPVIIPGNITNNKNMKSYSTIRFRVTDDLSGIKSYTGYIDGKWVLFEYDPKSDLIFYEIDRNRIEEGKMHDLELFITDNKNNMSSKFMQFYY